MLRISQLLAAGLILACLGTTGLAAQNDDVKFACVVFQPRGQETVVEGRISRDQFIKWFKRDYSVGGERFETPSNADAFGVLVMNDGKQFLVMPLYTWGKGADANFACQSAVIGKAPMFQVVTKTKRQFLASMKTEFAKLSELTDAKGAAHAASQSINLIIAQMRKGDIDARIAAAETLPKAIHEHSDKSSLAALAPSLRSLLRDDNDSIRYWAALSLAKLNNAPVDVVPDLIVALNDRVDEFSSKSSESAIRLALDKIQPDWRTRRDLPKAVRERWGQR